MEYIVDYGYVHMDYLGLQSGGRLMRADQPLGGAWCTGREMAIEIDWRLTYRGHFTVSQVLPGQIHQCHGQPHDALGYYSKQWRSPSRPESRS